MNNELKSLREKHNLSRQELADLLGYSPRTIESLEQGRIELSPRGRMVFEMVRESLAK